MKERPILFSAPMVRAILAGQKTQTRRIVKPLPTVPLPVGEGWKFEGPDEYGFGGLVQRSSIGVGVTPLPRCPYGLPGDRLWVREAWQYAGFTEDGYPFIRYRADGAVRCCERIDPSWSDRLTDIWATLSEPANFAIDGKAADRVWRPGIFLPHLASRLTLEVTEVSVQRIGDISEDDAKAEGMIFHDGRPSGHHGWRHDPGYGFVEGTPRGALFALWRLINGDDSLKANPWVWAISFRRVG